MIYKTLPNAVKACFDKIHKATGTLGGNSTGETMYGEFTPTGYIQVLVMVKKYFPGDTPLKIVDIGAGLGKPSITAAAYLQADLSIGIECDHGRYMVGI